jgi:hypothetical protein
VLANGTAFRYDVEILLQVLDITSRYFEVLLRVWTEVESISSADLHIVIFVYLKNMYRTAGEQMVVDSNADLWRKSKERRLGSVLRSTTIGIVKESLHCLVYSFQCLHVFLRFLQTLVRIEKPEGWFDLVGARHACPMLELIFYEVITSLSNRLVFSSRTLVCNVRQHTRRSQRGKFVGRIWNSNILPRLWDTLNLKYTFEH